MEKVENMITLNTTLAELNDLQYISNTLIAELNEFKINPSNVFGMMKVIHQHVVINENGKIEDFKDSWLHDFFSIHTLMVKDVFNDSNVTYDDWIKIKLIA